MEAFGKEREDWLRGYLDLEHGIAPHDTFERVFQNITPKYFRESLYALTNVDLKSLQNELIGIDGKKLRGESPNSKGTDGLYILTAWLSESCISIAEQEVEQKSNEIKDCTLSIDAMGCQRDIASLIRSKAADYILGVKKNQRNLLEEITECFSYAKLDAQDMSFDYGHGRIEHRTCSILSAQTYLSPQQLERWEGVKNIIQIESKRVVGDKTSLEKRYYISSKSEDAAYFNKNIRQHWSIENKLH